MRDRIGLLRACGTAGESEAFVGRSERSRRGRPFKLDTSSLEARNKEPGLLAFLSVPQDVSRLFNVTRTHTTLLNIGTLGQ